MGGGLAVITFATLIQIIVGLCGVIGALMWALIRGGSERREQERDLKAHERMNDADTGSGASDADNAEWLRKFAQRHRR